MSIRDTHELPSRRVTSDPAFADIVDYPESLAIGDTLFPMIYIYYFGNEEMKSKVGSEYLFEKGLVDYLQNRTALRTNVQNSNNDFDNQYKKFKILVKKLYLMFETSWKYNAQWLWSLSNAASNAMGKYSSRINYDPERPLPGSTYYKRHDPKTGKEKFSTLPVIDSSTNNDIYTSMEAFRILFENNLIPFDYNTGIRPINIFTGELAQEIQDVVEEQTTARYLGLPSQGIFTVNKTKKGATMYHTFSGIDITATVSLNTEVSDLDQLLSLSWSIHRGAMSTRTLGKSGSNARTGGGRTIAGSMIFALTDHHPLRNILSSNFKGRRTPILNSPEVWKPLVMADEIPPFDMVVILANEYGKAAITTLYGVQIVDEGGVFGVDNLVTEMSLQYTAVAMDPITEAELGEDGSIDPFGILQGGYSHMWRRRELMASGAGYSGIEDAYEAYYDQILHNRMERGARKKGFERVVNTRWYKDFKGIN